MRISDWSSDVCSSDRRLGLHQRLAARLLGLAISGQVDADGGLFLRLCQAFVTHRCAPAGCRRGVAQPWLIIIFFSVSHLSPLRIILTMRSPLVPDESNAVCARVPPRREPPSKYPVHGSSRGSPGAVPASPFRHYAARDRKSTRLNSS